MMLDCAPILIEEFKAIAILMGWEEINKISGVSIPDLLYRVPLMEKRVYLKANKLNQLQFLLLNNHPTFDEDLTNLDIINGVTLTRKHLNIILNYGHPKDVSNE